MCPRIGRVEKELLTCDIGLSELCEVNSLMNDSNSIARHVEVLSDVCRGMIGDSDDECALACCAAIDETPIAEFATREEVGKGLVLHIVNCRNCRNARNFGNHRAEGKVQHVELVELHLATNPAANCERRAHCVEPPRR